MCKPPKSSSLFPKDQFAWNKCVCVCVWCVVCVCVVCVCVCVCVCVSYFQSLGLSFKTDELLKINDICNAIPQKWKDSAIAGTFQQVDPTNFWFNIEYLWAESKPAIF